MKIIKDNVRRNLILKLCILDMDYATAISHYHNKSKRKRYSQNDMKYTLSDLIVGYLIVNYS